MGTHARPRRRVRAAALGTLAAGATLTGVGLTAAALDPSGAALADGTQGTEPVNFAASGLGAPVPVADVSSLDGSSAGRSVVAANGGSAGDGAGSGALRGAPLGAYSGNGYGEYVTGRKAAGTKVAGEAASAASSGASQAKRVKSTVTTPRSNPAPASASASTGSTGTAGNAVSADSVVPKIVATSGTTAASTGSRSSGGSGTSPVPATRLPFPSIDTSLPISTDLPVPSLPSLPTVASLTTAVNHAKSTVAGLLNEVAGLA